MGKISLIKPIFLILMLCGIVAFAKYQSELFIIVLFIIFCILVTIVVMSNKKW